MHRMMAEGDDVLEHINKIKMLAEQLDAVGAPVSEDDLVITLLASLSETYQFLITALGSRADSLTWGLPQNKPSKYTDNYRYVHPHTGMM
ncbi:Copia protein [Phytophthora megakarya]|uniref:Copia protein n=1 Tax=Phytophthora megakarya TaxID=4795 RepID=A0A225VY35_9STRA|nr:Copia protein [Phytophthora megakarya]